MDLVPQSELEGLLVESGAAFLSQEGALALAGRVQVAWSHLSEAGDQADAGKAGLIYNLSATVLEDGATRLWQVTKLKRDEQLATSWAEFCLRHLTISDTTASNYMRVYRVYIKKLGWQFRDLVEVGQGKLQRACSLVEQMYPDVPERLLRGLRGAPDVCVACDGYVPSPTDVCPHCGVTPFESIAPLKYSELSALVDQIKAERRGGDESELEEGEFEEGDEQQAKGVLRADVEEVDGESIRMVPWWQVDGERYDLPVWEIALLEQGVYGEGIPEDQRSALVRAIKSKF